MQAVEADGTDGHDIEDGDGLRPDRVTGRRLARDHVDARVDLLETGDGFRRQAGVADVQLGQGRQLGEDAQGVVVDLRAAQIERLEPRHAQDGLQARVRHGQTG